MLMSHLATVEFYKSHPIEFAIRSNFHCFQHNKSVHKKNIEKKNNYTSQPNKAHTVKLALNGHPWDPRKCLLNTGCPLNTGSI